MAVFAEDRKIPDVVHVGLRLERDDLRMKLHRALGSLFEHDLVRKPVPTLR
jgi:hypothetical protein